MILSNLAKKNGAPQIPVEIKLKSRGCNDEVRVQKVFRSLELKCTETEFLEQYQGLYEKELSKAKMMPGIHLSMSWGIKKDKGATILTLLCLL